MIQWGKVTSSTLWSTKEITLPLNFSNQSYSILFQDEYILSPITASISIKITGNNTFIAKVSQSGSSLYNASYFAIGY